LIEKANEINATALRLPFNLDSNELCCNHFTLTSHILMGVVSCLADDYMGNWSFEKELKPGDKIIFEDMIHYTTVKTTMFNGVNHPSIGIWSDKSGFKLIKEFNYQDYKSRLS